MTDWLNEIERLLKHRKLFVPSRGTAKRMARVLRELAKEIQYWRAYSNYQSEGTTGFRSVYCKTVVPERPNLSDDAKELLVER